MNWLEFFQDNKIEYATSGNNVSAGWIGTKCPFCGANDPSQHMGVRLNGPGWACWRDASHKGSKPHKLISALLGVSGAQAAVIADTYSRADPDTFNALQATTGARQAPLNAMLPAEFTGIHKGTLTHKFWAYLEARGFDPEDVIQRYNLMACLSGRWSSRLIIPVYGSEYELIGWQGRAILPSLISPRYLTSSPEVKQTLYNLQNLKGGDVLYLCEGPFDALKIDAYGYKHRINATCSFGVTMTPQQLYQASQLRKLYKRVILLLDNDAPALSASFGLSDWLPGVEFGQIPEGSKDPGSMSSQQIRRMLNENS